MVRESNAPRVSNVDFSLSVGTTVPRSVRLARVPCDHERNAVCARDPDRLLDALLGRDTA